MIKAIAVIAISAVLAAAAHADRETEAAFRDMDGDGQARFAQASILHANYACSNAVVELVKPTDAYGNTWVTVRCPEGRYAMRLGSMTDTGVMTCSLLAVFDVDC